MGLHSLRMQGELCTKDHNTCLTKAQHSYTLLRKTSYGAQCNHRRQLHCAKNAVMCSNLKQTQGCGKHNCLVPDTRLVLQQGW